MTIAASVLASPKHLRDKELVIQLTPTDTYQGPTTAIAKEAFTQVGAGAPLLLSVVVADTLSGNVTFSTAGGAGPATQVVNMATYSNLASATPATATAAAVALALALTGGALGVASHATYTGTVANGVVSIATDTALEVLSVTVSALVYTNPKGGGDTFSVANMANPKNVQNAQVGFPGVPLIWEVIGTPAGYAAKVIPGTTLTNWRLRVFSAMGTELVTGAYPAPILADTFTVRLVGPKLRF